MELIPLAKKQTQDGEEQEELSSGDSLKLDLYFWLQALVLALVVLLQSVGYEPKQGDVVVLTKAFRDVDGPIVKRVIAVGGQTVDIDYDAGTVAVDGQVLDEPYIHEAMLCPTYENQTHIEVPEGSIFVIGDNRNHSSDSRDVTLGTVDTRYLLGKAEFICFPFSDFGRIG